MEYFYKSENYNGYEEVLSVQPKKIMNSKNNFLCDFQHFDKSIDINPNNTFYYLNKETHLNNFNGYEEGLNEKSIEVNPNFSEAFQSIGISLNNLRRHEDALKYFDRSIELKPNNSIAFINKALSLKHLNRYDEAVNCFRRAVEINPNAFNASI